MRLDQPSTSYVTFSNEIPLSRKSGITFHRLIAKIISVIIVKDLLRLEKCHQHSQEDTAEAILQRLAMHMHAFIRHGMVFKFMWSRGYILSIGESKIS
jgi:hypothetical protein